MTSEDLMDSACHRSEISSFLVRIIRKTHGRPTKVHEVCTSCDYTMDYDRLHPGVKIEEFDPLPDIRNSESLKLLELDIAYREQVVRVDASIIIWYSYRERERAGDESPATSRRRRSQGAGRAKFGRDVSIILVASNQ